MAKNSDIQAFPDSAVNPAAIAVDDLPRMLGLAEAVVRRHVADGAPTNGDGSINLIHYAAWLNAPHANRGEGGKDGA